LTRTGQDILRVLITGASGFVGYHIAAHLHPTQPDTVLHGTVLDTTQTLHPAYTQSYEIDLRDANAVQEMLREAQPDAIYHLAAQAFVPRSFEDPWETLENNIRSQLNIIEGCLALDMRPRMLIISSAEVYGAVNSDQMPMDENTPLRPTNPYSVSKVTQDMMGLQYYLSHQLPIMRARAFNHIGPGQSVRFVAPAFANQIALIEANQQKPFIYVGNLEAKRDFTDVRDIVRAYALIIEKGQAGQAYNVASNKAYSIQYLLDTLLSYSEIDIDIRVDEKRLRPVDVPEIRGDTRKLHQDTGWQPTLTFEETLRDVLDDCRQRIQTTN
jgi:GDP-4-dehydro-6-deoxy-D-mannose reductase